MIYWTTYNFSGYLLYKANIIQMNSILKCSFICTSIIGGYMVYIYPRKLIIRYDNKTYNLPYPLLMIGDFITHQLPMIHSLYVPNEINVCGGYLIPLMMTWYTMNNIFIKNTKKIYGISLEKMILSVAGILSTIAVINHCPRIIDTCSKVCPKSILRLV